MQSDVARPTIKEATDKQKLESLVEHSRWSLLSRRGARRDIEVIGAIRATEVIEAISATERAVPTRDPF